MAERRSGTNRHGNDYTSYGGHRQNYYYKNQDGGRYFNAGQNQGSFYRNSDKGYQWYQNSSGERSYKPYGGNHGGQLPPETRSGVNRQGNEYTQYRDSPSSYSYENMDGGEYHHHGPSGSSEYHNADKGYEWYQDASGERVYGKYN